ncbi:hypothetical protein PR003_g34195, partial [Phytophthora rubi]
MGAAPIPPPPLHACRPDADQPPSQIWRVGDKTLPDVTSSSRRPSEQQQQYRVTTTATATTTGREHGDDGIELAGAGTSPAQLAAAARQQYRVTTTTTTGREHGDDGIEQAGAGT